MSSNLEKALGFNLEAFNYLYVLCDYETLLKKNITLENFLEILKKYDVKLLQYRDKVSDLELQKQNLGATILPESLPPIVSTPTGRKIASSHEIEIGDDGVDLDKVMGQIEKELLIKAIHAANGIKKKAAKLLHISFRSMRYRVEKYNLGTVGDDELDDE